MNVPHVTLSNHRFELHHRSKLITIIIYVLFIYISLFTSFYIVIIIIII